MITAELPPNTLADAEALIILLSPPAEPESMCMSVMARTPQYAPAVCGWEEEIDEEGEVGLGAPFSLIELGQTSDPALNGEIAKQIAAYYEGVSTDIAKASYAPEEPPEHKRFCRKAENRVLCKRFYVDGQLAAWAEDDIFNIAVADDTIANAFRHSLWNSMMRLTSPVNRTYAGFALAMAHEEGHWKPSNARVAERKRSQMDVLNNLVGTNRPGNSDMISCVAMRNRTSNAHYLGRKVEPLQWQKRVGYQYNRPVYRRLTERGTNLRVYMTGKDCGDVRIGWGPFQVNPFTEPWNASINASVG